MSTVKTVVSWVLFLVGLYLVIPSAILGVSIAAGLEMSSDLRAQALQLEGLIGGSIVAHILIGAVLIYVSRMSYFKH